MYLVDLSINCIHFHSSLCCQGLNMISDVQESNFTLTEAPQGLSVQNIDVSEILPIITIHCVIWCSQRIITWALVEWSRLLLCPVILITWHQYYCLIRWYGWPTILVNHIWMQFTNKITWCALRYETMYLHHIISILFEPD